MKIYIVGYFCSWGDERNCKIIGCFDSFERSEIEAKILVERLRKVFIVETGINNIVIPEFEIQNWIDDFDNVWIVE
jgi:hypothetical protein